MVEAIQFMTLTFIASVMTLCILSYLGLHVLEREIIFIDISLAQIAAVGATVAILLFPEKYDHGHAALVPRLFSIGFTTVAAMFFSFTAKAITRISHETIIGVSYAIAAAAALFLLAAAPGSDVHVDEMLTGSVLWIQKSDLITIAVVYVLVKGIHYLFRRQFINMIRSYRDKKEQTAMGMWWDFLFYALMGIVITFTVEFIGVLLTFAFLIIPATFSALFVRGWLSRLMMAWGMGLVVIIAGLYISYTHDVTCGPGIVALMGLGLIVASVVKQIAGIGVMTGKRTKQ